MPLERSKEGLKTPFARLGGLIYDFLGYVSYKIMAFISIIVLKLFFRLEVRNKEYVPAEGPIILAANHFSILDPWVLQVACPRRITYMVENVYYKSWGWWFYRMHKAIPVKERGLNKDAFVTGLNALKNNAAIGIFPEGWGARIDGKVRRGNPGVAMLSHKSRVPVLPIYIDGAYEILPKGAVLPRFTKLVVTYGRPISFNDIERPDKETLRKMTDEIMERIKELSGK